MTREPGDLPFDAITTTGGVSGLAAVLPRGRT